MREGSVTRLDQLRAAQEARTPGPWDAEPAPVSVWSSTRCVFSDATEADCDFAVLAANMMPDLLALADAVGEYTAACDAHDHDEQAATWHDMDTAYSRLRVPAGATNKETT